MSVPWVLELLVSVPWVLELLVSVPWVLELLVIGYYVASLDLPYFSTFSHKRHDFQEKPLLNVKCVF